MRWIPLLLIVFPVCVGCNKEPDQARFATVGQKIGAASSDRNTEPPMEVPMPEIAKATPASQAGEGHPVKAKAQPEPVEKRDKPRKIRYTADMKVIVDKLDDAQKQLDDARDKFDGYYEKVEINNSASVVRSGTWRVRVPVKDLNTFRKAVAKIGEVERDTLDSDDMTAKYYDLERHVANLKAREKSVREFLTEIGKKDPRFLEVWRELETITDDIDRKEGTLKLWANLTDLTTFTIRMSEKEPYDPRVVKTKEDPPAFGERITNTWDASWEAFLGFCQRVTIGAIWVAPWSPLILVALVCIWLTARRIARSEAALVAAAPASDTPCR